MRDYNRNNIKYAKELRKNMTPSERKLWYCFLRKYPVRFQRQKCIGNYIADFYCAKARLIIEVDGGGHFSKEQMEYDKKRTFELENMGLDLKVIRFLNSDIVLSNGATSKNFYEVCSKIDKITKERVEKFNSERTNSIDKN